MLQFFLIVAGFFPLVYLGLKNVGGWSGLKAKLPVVYVHSWQGMTSPKTNLLGVEWFGLVMGLGFVLSFGYWCTDFLVIQRAMAAKSMNAARRTPLIAAFPKMIFPFLVILPGIIAIGLPTQRCAAAMETGGVVKQSEPAGVGLIPVKVDSLTGKPMYDQQGNPVLDYDLGDSRNACALFPDWLAWAWD